MISIFVAKLDFGVDNAQLRALFETYGKVNKVTVAMDRETGKSRGFAFVEMEEEHEGLAAINGLDGRVINHRNIAVKKAEDRSNQRNQPNKFEGSPRQVAPSNNGPHRSRTENDPNDESDDEDSYTSTSVDLGENRKKAPIKVKDRKLDNDPDRSKKPKMDAYKKSGKKEKFLDDEDDLDIEGGLFAFDDEE